MTNLANFCIFLIIVPTLSEIQAKNIPPTQTFGENGITVGFVTLQEKSAQKLESF